MAAILSSSVPAARARRPARTIPWVPVALVGVALLYLTAFLFIPLFAVFFEALKKGWGVYVAAIREPDAVKKLSPEQQGQCRALWRDMNALLARAEAAAP